MEITTLPKKWQAKNRPLQHATYRMLEGYAEWCSHALTLTMHDTKNGTHVIRSGWAKGAISKYEAQITPAAAEASLRYFIEALNYKLWGRRTRNPIYSNRCRIVAIPVLEGMNGQKRLHAHLIIGNIPKEKLSIFEDVARAIWAQSKWGMARMEFREIYDTSGAGYYVAKEVGYINDDAVRWNIASIPRRLIGG